MFSTDPISDMLTRIRNANLRRHKFLLMPYSSFKKNILDVFLSEGFIKSYSVEQDKIKQLSVALKYDANNIPVIRGIKRESKPGRRLYRSLDKLPKCLNGQGVYVVSTSKGVMSDNMCRKNGVSGEIICSIF